MSGGVPAGELLPCPFCGGVARLDIGKQVFEDAEVSCVKCGCQGPNYDDGFGREDNARLATYAWNTRATPTPPIEGRDADVERDAARWRALMSSDRIRMMGCAGFDFADDGTVNLRAGVGHHMGVEVWDKHPARGDDCDTRGRKVLLAYVDARHRLAALASAPEQHSANGEVQKGEVTIAEREARRHGADSFDGKEFASAPAGDGVEDRDALAERLCAARFPTTVARHPDYYRVQLTEESRERWRVVADAALARPRAAVGEREASRIMRNALQDIAGAEPIPNDAVAFVWCRTVAADAILALQSPPAKVEVPDPATTWWSQS